MIQNTVSIMTISLSPIFSPWNGTQLIWWIQIAYKLLHK